MVAALQLPPDTTLPYHLGGYRFTGEEAVLLTLRRFVEISPSEHMGPEVGRSDSAISAIVRWTLEHIEATFPHLIDERSLTCWAPHFAAFAAAFAANGVPLQNLVGFVDGKVWGTCKPTRNQRVRGRRNSSRADPPSPPATATRRPPPTTLTPTPPPPSQAVFNGHKRMHGIKTQGVTLANGMQPYPFVMVEGRRHDGHMLLLSGLVAIIRAICVQLGVIYCLYGDAAYPLSPWLQTGYGGAALNLNQAQFNHAMSSRRRPPARRPASAPRHTSPRAAPRLPPRAASRSPLPPPTARSRIQVEWGFGKIVSLFPYLDYRKNNKVLLTPVALATNVANIFANMHTCLYGSHINQVTGLEPPSLEAYMAGGPF